MAGESQVQPKLDVIADRSPNRAAASLAIRDAAHLWHPYTQMLTRPAPIPVVRGEGVYLFTEDGRRLLDGTSSWWVNIHGHCHPRLNEALTSQAAQIEHVIFANCTHRPGVELAARDRHVRPVGVERHGPRRSGAVAACPHRAGHGRVLAVGADHQPGMFGHAG